VTKSDLVRKLSERFPNMFLKDIQVAVDSIFEEIAEALTQEKRVELRGFGAFTVRRRKSRQARNPRTNELVNLDERLALYFRAGKELNVRLNKEDK
jgi:integration host factor subunit beta